MKVTIWDIAKILDEMNWSFQQHDDENAIITGYNGENVDFSIPIKNGPLDLGFDYYFGISASLNMPPHAFIENRFVQGELVYAATRAEIKKLGLTGAKEGWIDKNFIQSEVLPEFTRKTVSWIKKHQQKNSNRIEIVFLIIC